MREESIMDNFEKVEKLRERAEVSYEEAKAALEENGWDLLDAMVALEKKGKTESPKQQRYSTSYEQQEELIPVVETVKKQQKDQPRIGRTIGNMFRRFFQICRDNTLCIDHRERNVARLPLLVVVILLLCFWKLVLPVVLISLLFGVRYSFEGKDDLNKANAFMESAGDMAESLKEGFMKAGKADGGTGSGTEKKDEAIHVVKEETKEETKADQGLK